MPGEKEIQYWRVILDGADGKQWAIYYHKVLEAELVIEDRFVISLGI